MPILQHIYYIKWQILGILVKAATNREAAPNTYTRKKENTSSGPPLLLKFGTLALCLIDVYLVQRDIFIVHAWSNDNRYLLYTQPSGTIWFKPSERVADPTVYPLSFVTCSLKQIKAPIRSRYYYQHTYTGKWLCVVRFKVPFVEYIHISRQKNCWWFKTSPSESHNRRLTW